MVLVEIEPGAAGALPPLAVPAPDPAQPRADLRALLERRHWLDDAARSEAVRKHHDAGGRTVRENLADLLDPGSFVEYGALAVAAQRNRRTFEDLQRNTPADGLITSMGSVGAHRHGPERARLAVMAYDRTVLAGTQGRLKHRKSDRLLDICE